MQNEENQAVDLENNEVVETTESSTEPEVDWKAEALKQKAINERISKKLSKPSEITNNVPHETVKPSDILRSDEFKLHRMGYNEKEIDLIMNNGGMKVLDDKSSPLVLGLQASREQRKAEEAASFANDSSGMSELERKYTKADLEKMTTAELEKILPHAN